MGIRVFALSLFLALVVLAVLVLRNDPIQVNEVAREQAVGQVKNFANYIEQHPVLARTKTRTVLDAKVSDFLPRPIGKNSEHRLTPILGRSEGESLPYREPQVMILELSRPEVKQEFENWVLKNPGAAHQFFYDYFSEIGRTQDALPEVWSDYFEGFMMLSQSHPDAQNLDLAVEQLLKARKAGNDLQRYQADQFFERYIKIETRPKKLQEAVDAYGQQVVRHSP